jgi:hypothetical protein
VPIGVPIGMPTDLPAGVLIGVPSDMPVCQLVRNLLFRVEKRLSSKYT